MDGDLTPRELEVVEAIRHGAFTYKAIRVALDGDPAHSTVRTLVRRIGQKIPLQDGPTLIRVVVWARENDDGV